MENSQYLTIGRLTGTHGIRGEVSVYPTTDFPEVRFASGNQLMLLHTSIHSPLTLTVERSRPHKNKILIQFKEWQSINEAEPFKGGELVVSKNQEVNSIKEGEYYYHQIIGCKVVTLDDKVVGTVTEILSLPANDVWIITQDDKEWLLPYIDEIVKEVDVGNRCIRIQWMEGLG